MIIEATINILDPTKQGTSQATGYEWKEKTAVFSYKNSGGYSCTIAAVTRSEAVIAELEKCRENMSVKIDVDFAATARTWKREDGTEVIFRSNNAILKAIEPLEF